MSYYWFLLLPTFVVFKIITKSETRVGKYYRYKRRKWKELKEMVSSQYSSTFDIYRVSWMMILQAFYQDILSFFDNRVIKKGKKLYEIKYFVEGQIYKFPLKVKRGPPLLTDARTENNECVLLILKQYCLPDGSLSNPLVTPEYFGYQSITVQTKDGDFCTFREKEPIHLPIEEK